MLSPTPLPLICALLICLPLAVLFTLNRSTTTLNSQTLSPPTFYIPATRPNVNYKPIISPPHRLNPPPPPVSESDASLLRIASRVNPKPTPPGARKKLAFMFLTTSPLPFAPIWELFLKKIPPNKFNIYIHADPGYDYDPQFSGVFANRVIPSKTSLRNTPTLASAARRLLAHALIHDPSNYMFALLSPSCIPIHSFDFTYRTLIRSKRSFIEILKNEVGTYDRWAARGEEVMLPEVKLKDFRIGSQFWVLTRKHARIIVRDRKIWSKFKLPCVRWDTCYPEENYFPTLLSMRDPRGCIPATLTHVDWTASVDDGHPRLYNVTEVGAGLIRSLRRRKPRYGDDDSEGPNLNRTKRHDPFLFARKFPPNAAQRLMRIANQVLFKD